MGVMWILGIVVIGGVALSALVAVSTATAELMAALCQVLLEGARWLGRLGGFFQRFTVNCPVCEAPHRFEKVDAARLVVEAEAQGRLDRLVDRTLGCGVCGAELSLAWRAHPYVRALVQRAEAARASREALREIYGASGER